MANTDTDRIEQPSGDGGEPIADSGGNSGAAGSGNRPGFRVGEPITINPAAIGSGEGDSGNGSASEPIRKRRGRKPGSRNKTTAQASNLNISALEHMLFTGHQMLALIVQSPELEIEAQEAKLLAESAGRVAAHYDLAATQKSIDWSNLLMLVAMTYIPRAIAVRNRNRKPAPEPIQTRPPANAPTAQPNTANGTRAVNIPGIGRVEVPVQ